MARMLIWGLLALLICSAKSATFQGPCPWMDSTMTDGKCMKFINIAKSFFDAQMYCEQQPGGGQLVELLTQQQYEAVKAMAGTTRVWIGAVEFRSGDFRWRSGAPIKNFMYWGSGQPNNGGGYEDCVELDYYKNMNDLWCMTQLAFICEPTNPKPAPLKTCDSWTDSVEVNDKCVKFFNTRVTWNEARRQCEELPGGGRLVEMTTLDEWNRNRDLAHGNTFWVGGVQIAHLQARWQSSESFSSFIKWESGQPNNLNLKEDCVAVGPTGGLDDINCQLYQTYMCEAPLEFRPNVQCPAWEGAVKIGGVCMKLFTRPMSWFEAEAHCESQPGGGQLAELHSLEEYEGLIQLAGGLRVWIGAVEFRNLEWKWRSNTPLKPFIPWDVKQPDNYQNNEDCLEINYSKKLNDLHCLEDLAFVCEAKLGKSKPLASCSEWPGSVQVHDKCVQYYPTKLTWHQARRHCEVQPGGGRLVEPETLFEFSRDKLQAVGQEFYLGGVQVAQKQYRWASGGSMGTFITWQGGQPDNAGNNENCAYVFTNGLLWDSNCHVERGFMCEVPLLRKEASPCPEWETNVTDCSWAEETVRVDNKCMKIIRTQVSWAEAQIRCQGQPGGGQLAELLTTEQFQTAQAMAGGLRAWVGGVEFRDKDWKWRSGESIGSHIIWEAGQPNNYGGNEDCTEINAYNKLNDLACLTTLNFICEPPPAKPAPIGNCDAWKNSVQVNGKCVKFFGSLVTWNEARRQCETQPGGGRLVEMKTLEEWDKVGAEANGNEFWMGAMRISDKRFKWNSGDNFKYFVIWALNQPDNQYTRQDCADVNAVGQVNDVECQSLHTFMCETEQAGKKRLKLVNELKTWQEALNYCRNISAGADLVSMETSAEFDETVALANGVKIWTGGKNENGKFMWSSGKPVDDKVVRWSGGEPDKSGPCIEMVAGGKIGDRECITKRPFICQFYTRG